MEEAGWLWVQTRGVTSRLVQRATECPFDHVGVYWRVENGLHAFVLVGALTRRPVTWSASGGEGVVDSTTPSVETAVLLHPDVVRVDVMPFFRPVLRDVMGWAMAFVQHVLACPVYSITSFIASPEPLTHLLPPLPPSLSFIPHCAFPGINILKGTDTAPTLERDGDVLLELGAALCSGTLVLDHPTSATGCMWCQSYRGVLDALDRLGHVPAEHVKHLITRLGSRPDWIGAGLGVVPADLCNEWGVFLDAIRAREPDVVLPLELVNRTAALMGRLPVEVTHPYAVTITPSAPPEGYPDALPLQTVRRIPLFGAQLGSLDRFQLEELERHLGHPSAVIDPTTSELRQRVHERLYRGETDS